MTFFLLSLSVGQDINFNFNRTSLKEPCSHKETNNYNYNEIKLRTNGDFYCWKGLSGHLKGPLVGWFRSEEVG